MESETNRPVETFREGAIGASVWRREGRNGPFYEFTLSRSYVKSEEEAGYSQSFRQQNELALIKVITQVAEFIRAQEGEKLQAA
jgi:hypothetical protein